jgi:Protein of unknown function (DUF1566)
MLPPLLPRVMRTPILAVLLAAGVSLWQCTSGKVAQGPGSASDLDAAVDTPDDNATSIIQPIDDAGEAQANDATQEPPAASIDARVEGATDATTTVDAQSLQDSQTDATGRFSCDAAAPQMQRYEAWANWPMPSAPTSGLPNPQSYSTAVAGVVVDNVTGLWWQSDVLDQAVSWDTAMCYCSKLDLAGHSDWRVPSRIELVSIYDETRVAPPFSSSFPLPPSADPVAPNGKMVLLTGAALWTSTSLAADSSKVLQGDLFWVSVRPADKTTVLSWVRCVRAGPTSDVAPPARYQIAAGTVQDTVTKATWQMASQMPVPWSIASTACGGAWRLPTIGELETLVDEAAPGVCSSGRTSSARCDALLDMTAFPGAPSTYWTSSIEPGLAPTDVWAVDLSRRGEGISGCANCFSEPSRYPGRASVLCVQP